MKFISLKNKAISTKFSLILDSLIKLLLVLILVQIFYSWILYGGTLILVKFFNLPTNNNFFNLFIYRSCHIPYFFCQKIWQLSFQIIAIVTMVCLSTSILLRLLMIIDYFYGHNFFFTSLISTVFLNTFFSALIIENYFIFSFKFLMLICFFPTLIINHFSIKFMSTIIPNLRDIIISIFKLLK